MLFIDFWQRNESWRSDPKKQAGWWLIKVEFPYQTIDKIWNKNFETSFYFELCFCAEKKVKSYEQTQSSVVKKSLDSNSKVHCATVTCLFPWTNGLKPAWMLSQQAFFIEYEQNLESNAYLYKSTLYSAGWLYSSATQRKVWVTVVWQ